MFLIVIHNLKGATLTSISGDPLCFNDTLNNSPLQWFPVKKKRVHFVLNRVLSMLTLNSITTLNHEKGFHILQENTLEYSNQTSKNFKLYNKVHKKSLIDLNGHCNIIFMI